jgi:hypothetical protein
MKPTLCALALALLLGAGVFAADTDPEPPGKKLTKEDVEKAEKAVKAYLNEVNGSHAQVKHIADGSVETVLPGYAFFSVLFRQFPVGRIPPAKLKASNVFVVARGGKPVPLTSAKELEKLFKEKLPALSSRKRLEAAATAWVRLSQEFIQDGFYTFTLEKDATKVVDRKTTGRSAIAKVVVMRGGNGTLVATLDFNKTGKLEAVKEESKIQRGPRPICQATKLLDKDPIVRGMAEQALLCMGRACKYYLDEQRAKASPALKKAIDRIWKRIVESDR